MSKRVVVPLDGSKFAERAVGPAAAAARRLGGELRLVMVHRPVPALTPFDARDMLDPTLDRQVRTEEQRYLEHLSSREDLAALTVTTDLLDGPIADAIHAYVTREQAALVVMTTHGRGPVSRFWLGSVADRLVRVLDVPILLLRPDMEQAALPDGPLHVLVPLDGSARADQALWPVRELGLPAGSVLQLLQVIEPVIPVWVPDAVPVAPEPAPLLQERKLAAMRHLHDLAGLLRQEGHTVHVDAPVEPDVARTIVAHAREHRAQLIAIATRGLGGATRFLLGSVADKVVRSAECPVLVWRRPEQA